MSYFVFKNNTIHYADAHLSRESGCRVFKQGVKTKFGYLFVLGHEGGRSLEVALEHGIEHTVLSRGVVWHGVLLVPNPGVIHIVRIHGRDKKVSVCSYLIGDPNTFKLSVAGSVMMEEVLDVFLNRDYTWDAFKPVLRRMNWTGLSFNETYSRSVPYNDFCSPSSGKPPEFQPISESPLLEYADAE